MSVLELCQWIQDTQIGTAIRESLLVFPIIEGTHVISLAFSIGVLMWFDLRLMGVMMREEPVSEVFAQVKPWILAGFGLTFLTGGLLFWSYAAKCYNSSYFRVKMMLLVLAGVNVLVYHLTIDRRKSEWDRAPVPPSQARMAGFLSLLLWLIVVAVGRLMAYNLN